MPDTLTTQGRIYRRGSEGYEAARIACVWRANTPDRYPEIIARVASDADIVAAVKLAKAENLKVGVRSGGHSWTSPHLRDQSLLIDLDALRDIEIDGLSLTAWVRPSVKGRGLNDALKPYGLMAPTGHHDTVACGGFLMCGGFGWNWREWGNGCRNVLEIECVTADGALIRASATQNADYYWAARGGGAGFFGVVTRFKVQAYPRRSHMRANGFMFPGEYSEAVLTWLYDILPSLPISCELVASWSAYDPTQPNAWTPVRMMVSGLAFASSEAEAEAIARIFDTCPVADKATSRRRNEPTTLEERYASGTAADPHGFRFAADNIYTDKGAAEIVPLIRPMIDSLPTPRSHIFWCYNGPRPDFSGMALSAWGETYFAAYSLWDDPAEDPEMKHWVVDAMQGLQPIANGEAQMNDENMEAHPQAYLSEPVSEKLERLRAQHDPEGRFLSFLRKPQS